jgi:putative FmdB family regulatory protein
MPLYEYQCSACGHQFELIRKFSDPPLERCPVCGGTVQKLMSSPAFQFKGSGWYITDYARKDQAGAKADEPKTDGAAKETSAGDKAAEKSDKPEKAEPKADKTAGEGAGAGDSKNKSADAKKST